MKLMKLAAVAAALAVLPAAAQAAVTYSLVADSSYEFTGGISVVSGAFELTTNSYVTSDTTFTAADVTSCSLTLSNGSVAACANQRFFPLAVYPGDAISFGFSYDDGQGFASVNYFFDPGAFAANGSYESTLFGADQHATLTVSGFAEPGGSVPEPATWALMIGGFGLAGAALRRRNGAMVRA